MIRSRNAAIIVAVSIVLFVSLFMLYDLSLHPPGFSSWAGLIVGGGSGLILCVLMQRSIGKNSAPQEPQPSNSRWMIPSIVGGMFLAKIVSNNFSPDFQSFVNNMVSSWIVVVFSYMAFVAWRHVPKE